MKTRLPGFWEWLLRGTGERAGVRRLFDGWAIVHLAVGAVLVLLIHRPIGEIAEKALFPMMAIFVGLTFSWAGNAHALLQSNEVIKLGKARPGGVFEYVYTFQLCILVMLFTITIWIIPVLKLPFLIGGVIGLATFNQIATGLLFALLSLALRTSWQAVLGANMLLIIRVQSSID